MAEQEQAQQPKQEQAQQPNEEKLTITQEEYSKIKEQLAKLETNLAVSEKQRKELVKLVTDVNPNEKQPTADELIQSTITKDGFFRNKDGTFMDNVDVCAKLYEIGMALKREGSKIQFSDNMLEYLKIATDKTKPKMYRETELKANLIDDLSPNADYKL